MKNVEINEIKEASGVRRRLVHVNLPKKDLIFSTPCFFVEPKSSWDVDFLSDWVENNKFKKNCFQGVIIPFNNVKKLLLPKKTRSVQLNLDGTKKENGFLEIIENKVIIIDPLGESSYLSLVDPDQIDIENLPLEYVEQIKKIGIGKKKGDESRNKKRIDKIKLFREYIHKLHGKEFNHTLKFLQRSKRLGSKILLAPSNLIIPEVSESLDMAIKINKETEKICKTHEGWIPAANFVLKTSTLEEYDYLDKILKYINEEQPQFFFFKIVDSYGLDSRNAGIQRDNLKRFLKGLKVVSKKFKIPVFALNVDSLGLFMLQAGIDGFSTPSNGIVENMFVSYKNTDLPSFLKGKYFYYYFLSMISLRALKKIYDSHGKKFPCPYGCCNEYNGRDFSTFIGKTKSKLTRTHYFNTMDNLVLETQQAIENDSVRAAFNKLAESSCKHYLEIIPNH
ncbi:hypothetical protein CEE44_00830 [Candidatus Woesearchaeota archaeon B3_Woes]|nr:MAG: hypothetical protein CEE44_00830 [Candidatus Woesearchaeota archaeon B3_Woes]